MEGVSLHWFRRCLRLHDNEALSKAMESNTFLIPLYVLDPEHLDVERMATNQMGFLLNTLHCLHDDLKKKGSRLFIAKGKPVDVVEKFVRTFKVNTLTFQRDTDSYNRAVDEQMLKMAASHDLKTFTTWGNTLYEMDHLLALCQGHPPPSQETFVNLLSSVGSPLLPVRTPNAIPPPPTGIGKRMSKEFDNLTLYSTLCPQAVDLSRTIDEFTQSEVDSASTLNDTSSPQCPESISSPPPSHEPIPSPSQSPKPIPSSPQSTKPIPSPPQSPKPIISPSQSPKPIPSPTQSPKPISSPRQSPRPIRSPPQSPELIPSPPQSPDIFLSPPTSPITVPSSPQDEYNDFEFMNEIPMLSDLKQYGYVPEDFTSPIVAGEKAALQMMEVYFVQRQRLSFNCSAAENNAEKQWYAPPEKPISLMTVPQEVKLSPYIAWGSLSVRLLYQRLQKALRSPGMAAKQLLSSTCRCVQVAPLTLEERLFSREYAYLISFSRSNFGQLIGRPKCLCMHIPWVAGDEADRLLQKWEFGETGFPAVDACMNQLRSEGWMHDLCRHMVASFLTCGGLMVYWELGRNVFEKYLLDFDWSINSYHWHWLSCAAVFQEYFTALDPTTFLKKCDPSGSFVRKYVPALQRFPDEFIYEPWKAPLGVQEESGCVVGKDYPEPIVDNVDRAERNMRQIRKITAEFLDFV